LYHNNQYKIINGKEQHSAKTNKTNIILLEDFNTICLVAVSGIEGSILNYWPSFK